MEEFNKMYEELNKKASELFKELNDKNVNDYKEDRDGLSYLSWTYAIQEISKKYNFEYEIEKFENNLPYVYDENTGYMVFTKVTINGITKEMWLPVMDSKNKAMKKEPYTYTTKYGEKTVESATMFEINKTIMRCLVKNLAMFGLGLYIYAGEDLPETDVEYITQEQKNRFKELGIEEKSACAYCKVATIDKILKETAQAMILQKEKALEKSKEAK